MDSYRQQEIEHENHVWSLRERNPSLTLSYPNVDPDRIDTPVFAIRLGRGPADDELPLHSHRKGQLVIAENGSVTCRVENGIWMVPTFGAFWVPGGIAHSNSVSPNGSVICVFVDGEVSGLPRKCCTLGVTPLMRVITEALTQRSVRYTPDSPSGRLAQVLMDEFAKAPTSDQHLPMSSDPRLVEVAEHLLADPADRRTVAEWAAELAMSERSFARWGVRETGLTFGQWRRQLHGLVALERLSAGSSVHIIAQDLGYESTSAFITMFKKVFGDSPRRYLRRIEATGDLGGSTPLA